MTYIKKTTLLILMIAILSCSTQEKQVLIIDSWWNTDYAKISCLNKTPCIPDPVTGVNSYERQLITKFSSEKVCGNILVIQYNGPQKDKNTVDNLITKKHWVLSINYSSEVDKQHWQLLDSEKMTNVFEGTDGPSETSRIICNILNNEGAKLSQ